MFKGAYQAGADAIEYRGEAVDAQVWDALVLRYLDAEAPMVTLRCVWGAILAGSSSGRSPLSVPDEQAALEATGPEAQEAAWASGVLYGVPRDGPADPESVFAREYLIPVRLELEAQADEAATTRVVLGLLAVLLLLGSGR